jgi:hypothetical protein
MVSPALREGFPEQVTGEPGGCVNAAAPSAKYTVVVSSPLRRLMETPTPLFPYTLTPLVLNATS